jgi:Winged helix-turn helix
MCMVEDVQTFWKTLSRSLRRMIVGGAMRCDDPALGTRCKIVRNLARGESPTVIARILGCGRTTVYCVGKRFLESGLEGLADRRAENGELKVCEAYVAVVLEAVAGSPQEHGFQRTTRTPQADGGLSVARGR